MQRCSHRSETFSLNVLSIEQLNDLYLSKSCSFLPNHKFLFCVFNKSTLSLLRDVKNEDSLKKKSIFFCNLLEMYLEVVNEC